METLEIQKGTKADRPQARQQMNRSEYALQTDMKITTVIDLHSKLSKQFL